MQGISNPSPGNWIEQTLDGLDALRDSVERGREVAINLRKQAAAQGDELLFGAADMIDAFIHYFQNDLTLAASSFDGLLKKFSECQSLEGAFFANTGLIIVLRKMGEVSKAFALAEKFVAPQLELVSPRLAILALNIVAIVYQERGETVQAIRCFYRALDEARKINSANRIAQVTANLGEVLYVTGNSVEAEEFLKQSCEIALSSSEKWLLPFSSTMLALCKISLGKFDEAYQAIAQYIEHEHVYEVQLNSYRSFYLSVAAYTLAKRGNLQEAMRFSDKAFDSIDMIEDPHLKLKIIFYD